ncbi:apoptotic chromatin condensation inducer in the nucleus [Rhodamnia argentea]|uniref:Apoptotic chromatin condensation inducer in the nucleus n=1 Tax=Rhodamnia argentea TaxID=178133 RepID=A0A8B8PJR8_9MYRT|nr:apoptotic chromatin condensation inducer in the nucleus [Rhodamnia argentea]
MSSYPILGNRPIDQWKVTELKEELKRRKLTTRGLKDDLVKRLAEAVNIERENAEKEKQVETEFTCDPQLETIAEDGTDPVAFQSAKSADDGDKNNDELVFNYGDDRNRREVDAKVQIDINDSSPVLDQPAPEGEGTDVGQLGKGEEELVVPTMVEVPITVTRMPDVTSSDQDLQNLETKEENRISKMELENEHLKPLQEDVVLDSPAPNNQVSEVSASLGFQVRSDSISADSVSINEKNESKDNIIADNVKLELDVKPEMVEVEPSSSNVVPVGGESHLMDVEEPPENKLAVEVKEDNDAANADMNKLNEISDVGDSEKLNLDRSSGDDSLDEDVLDSKHVESKPVSDEVGGGSEKKEVTPVKEESPVDIMGDADPKDVSVERNGQPLLAEKRKILDQGGNGSTDPAKRQRRWKSESVKDVELQRSNVTPVTTPRDGAQTPSFRPTFSRTNSAVSDDTPKERTVPPPQKPPTTSLRIDRFLRPFTLKAVQELLGKTGSVTSFWMDQIKTHCYVMYSSVEEAIETRNAVYNLQWPPNGGRQLVAEFVDPQEVKARLEAPPTPTPAPPPDSAPTAPLNIGPSTVAPPTVQPQPSPRQLPLRQQQLPPPPPLPHPQAKASQERDRLPLPPPPPPLSEKVDPTIVTLDVLFKKTKASPRIYYLPLSEDQVAAKLAAQRRTGRQ